MVFNNVQFKKSFLFIFLNISLVIREYIQLKYWRYFALRIFSQTDGFYTEKVRPEVVLLIKLLHGGERCPLNRNRPRLPETSLNK